MDAVALTAHYSIPHLSLTILSASAAKGTLSAGALKDFLARTDRWTGSFLPETRADWATALGMPAGSSQKQVLARIVELGTARKERERDRYLTDQVATFAVNELRICVASRRGMEIKGRSASQAALFLTCLATELREFLALARPRPVLLATANGFRIAEPLVLLTAADGKWHIEQ